MKTIGLIGGMTWESTADYYRVINREVQRRLGGVHSAKIVMASLDFAGPESMARTAQWDALATLLTETGRTLKQTGADFLVICANTAHRVADPVRDAVGLPLLHVCDVTAAAIREAGLGRVSLLGTRYTMQEAFFRDRLRAGGLDVFTPDEDDQLTLQQAIEQVWRTGTASDEARTHARAIVQRQAARGAQGIILGCTELPVLIARDDASVPLFDTMTLHAIAAADKALA